MKRDFFVRKNNFLTLRNIHTIIATVFLMKKSLTILWSLGIIFTLIYCYVAYLLPLTLPPLPYSTVIRDVRGEEIAEIIADERIRHREMTYQDIPRVYASGIIWLEDRNFWNNNGISMRGIIRSIVHNLEAWSIVEWGSTLSAQYIRNVLWINEGRDLEHKILESLYAIRLNYMVSKEAILTAYVNRIGFGHLNYGLRSAAIYYFGREPQNLTPAEQIALLVIPKNPNKYDPYIHEEAFSARYHQLISLLATWGIITADEAATISGEHLLFVTTHRPLLPYVRDFIQGDTTQRYHTGSAILLTTIDTALTNRINTLAQSILDSLSWRNVSDYGVLIAERTATGPVLRVMIGGKDYHESSEWQVNTTLSLRQPGSTLKPFTYVLAFSRLALTPESTITDLPIQYKTAEGYSYEPKNYSQDYKWELSLREALSQSINIPAIKLLEAIHVDTLLDFLHALGISSLKQSSDHYGLALTLGDGEVTLYELLQAYSIFPYGGEYCEITYILHTSTKCVRKIDQKYTDMVTSILSDRYVKLPEFPINSSLDFPDRRVALKTGTSRNFRDNWTIGFTDHYMIGVWTGNKNGENMKWVSGATGAGEIFARIVYALEKEDTRPTLVKGTKLSKSFLEITSPLDGSSYMRNPSRSENLQKIALTFHTNIPYDIAYWIYDGERREWGSLFIKKGNHSVEIILEKEGRQIAREKSSFTVSENS